MFGSGGAAPPNPGGGGWHVPADDTPAATNAPAVSFALSTAPGAADPGQMATSVAGGASGAAASAGACAEDTLSAASTRTSMTTNSAASSGRSKKVPKSVRIMDSIKRSSGSSSYKPKASKIKVGLHESK